MVSLWPWRGDDNSPASFEKTLSTLSDKISQTTNRLDSQRKRSRRFKALWTLYTTFAYLLYSIILALVLGWRNWRWVEYAALVGGPLLIYLVRLGLTTYYDFRTSTTQAYLEDLQQQRDKTIEKLKVATKYNSTQQLLEKYSGSSTKSTPAKGAPKRKATPNQASPNVQQGGRTGMAPPPTANIPRLNSGSSPSTPVRSLQSIGNSPVNPAMQPSPASPVSSMMNEPGFAPNAFPAPPQYVEQRRWYDRIMDVLLGEDETLPKNRLALICKHCRLVNGQAPPGIKDLEEVGKWKCGGCGGWNGEENEARKIVKEMQEEKKADEAEGWREVSKGDEKRVSEGSGTEDEIVVVPAKVESVDEDQEAEDPSGAGGEKSEGSGQEEEPTTEPKRGRPKSSRKKG